MLAEAANEEENRKEKKEKQQRWERRDKAARTIQAYCVRRQIISHRHDDATVTGDAGSSAELSVAGLQSWSTVVDSVLSATAKNKRRRRVRAQACQRAVFAISGISSLLLGVGLMSFVEIRIRDQEDKCREVVGSIATCMRPRRYFSENGIFGETGCCFEDVTAANCSGSHLLEAFVPDTPEAADV